MCTQLPSFTEVGAQLHRHTPPRELSTPAAVIDAQDSDESTPQDDTGAQLQRLSLGEPANKVFVQFSNNLDGFVPCLLLLTEDEGLRFTRDPAPPIGRPSWFIVEPGGFIKVCSPISRRRFLEDKFWRAHSKHVHQNNLLLEQINKDLSRQCMLYPPDWFACVVSIEACESGTAGALSKYMILIAVQTFELSRDLVDGCKQLMLKRKQERNDIHQRRNVG
mmetsp:Transcript_9373/g.23671  ORF Transcript_9373/g.23671 Transcript_9373/m.23671 type:complete len:220 (+) Transcript_9373:339-998(+)